MLPFRDGAGGDFVAGHVMIFRLFVFKAAIFVAVIHVACVFVDQVGLYFQLIPVGMWYF